MSNLGVKEGSQVLEDVVSKFISSAWHRHNLLQGTVATESHLYGRCCSVTVFPTSVSGCVDPWEPKVLRAGMGAHFRLPIVADLDWESVPSNLPAAIQVYVADNKDPNARAEDTSAPRGSSRAGPAHLKSKPKAAHEDEDEEGAAGVCIPELAVQYYYENWTQAAVAVVIGGETHGLSLDALQLAASTGGKRLVIPMVPGMDSLNSAMAAAIVLFEGRRQLLQRHKQEDERQTFPVVG